VHWVSSSMRDGIHDFYDAWNRQDAAAITAAFVAGGTYADPLTVVDLDGTKLTEHLQSVLEVIRDLRITVLRTISAEDATAAVWRSKESGTASLVS
jgi:SnoaL-like domain